MGGESLRPYLKMQNLFVRDINKATSPSVVKAALEKAGGPLAKVVLPLDYSTNQSTHIGQAYINFSTVAEAECCLEKIRFKLVFGGQMAKVLHAPGGSQSDKDKIWGPYAYKFQIIVKNLSDEVEIDAFYDFFSKFGEVLQCKTDTDSYGQYFGQVQYMDTKSVAAAVEGANGTRWHGAVIQVVPHHKASQADSVTPAPQRTVDVTSRSSFPALGHSTPSTPPVTAGTPTGTRALASTQQPAQTQTQQQQQRPPPAVPPAALVSPSVVSSSSPGPINFAVQALEAAGGSGSNVGTPTSSSTRPLAFSGSSGNLHVGAPVVAPPAVASPFVAPVTAPLVSPALGSSSSSSTRPPLPLPQPALSRGVNTGASAAAAIAAAAGLQPPGAAAAGLSVLDRIALRRAEKAAVGSTAAAPSPGIDAEGVAAQQALVNGVGVGGGERAQASGGSSKRGGVIAALKAASKRLAQVTELLNCPITHDVLEDPVVAADGITYSRTAISDWLSKSTTSPMTNIPLANLELHPNTLVRTLIEELL